MFGSASSRLLKVYKSLTWARNYSRSGRAVLKNWIRTTRTKKGFLRSNNLLISNTVICCVMGGLGDVFVQTARRTPSQNVDKRRTLNLTLTGVTIGPCCHFWYQILDRFLPGRTFSTVVKKVFVDQIIFSPICIGVFFLTLGLLKDESSSKDVGREIYRKGLTIYTTEWFVWPPAQLLNFYLVPLKFRVLFDNIVSFGFDMFQSHVCYGVSNVTPVIKE